MNKEEIVSQTWLSPREAELYILHVEEGKSITEVAKEMGIERGSAASQWASVKEKIRKSEKTAEMLDL